MIKSKVCIQALEVIKQTNSLKEKIPNDILKKITKKATREYV